MERLRDACTDWDGTLMQDAEEPRVIPDCATLREAADRIEALEQAVDAFADICDELGCERDNEAGLQAARQLRAKVARMGEALKEIEAHDIRIEYHGLATSPSVVEIGPMGQIARSALQSEKDREGGE